MAQILQTLVQYLQAFFAWLPRFAWEMMKEHPLATLAAGAAVARTFGTVVQTGWTGVLFSFGRVKSELQPGFHWLIPVVHHVRKVRVRSISIDLPVQRIVTVDGLVFDVDSNAVYRISDPKTAVIQIHDVHEGCRTVIPLVVAELMCSCNSEQLTDRLRLDSELTARVQSQVERWGVVVEHAGLQSIAPTPETLRLTQLRMRCELRAQLCYALRDELRSSDAALALLGASTRLIEKSVLRRRGYLRKGTMRQRTRAGVPSTQSSWKVGDRVLANWWELGEYYPAVITKIESGQLHVKYDDGNDETVITRNVRPIEQGSTAKR